MTDTTDIKALREAATKYAKSLEAHISTPLDHALVREMDSACWELTDLIGNNELSIVINLLEQLEAERQRAERAKSALDSMTRQRDEVERLRVVLCDDKENLIDKCIERDKEIAALKGDQVPVAEIKFHPSTDKHPCMYWFGKQDRDFPVGTQFFTAPQKPVVLPVADHETEDGYKYYREETVKAAIEAAGGKVIE